MNDYWRPRSGWNSGKRPKPKANSQMKPVHTEIFKLQAPLVGEGRILVYNKSQTINFETERTEHINSLLDGGIKVYVSGWIDKNYEVHLDKRVPAQNW